MEVPFEVVPTFEPNAEYPLDMINTAPSQVLFDLF
jgi:hypothetical protein